MQEQWRCNIGRKLLTLRPSHHNVIIKQHCALSVSPPFCTLQLLKQGNAYLTDHKFKEAIVSLSIKLPKGSQLLG